LLKSILIEKACASTDDDRDRDMEEEAGR
jgi:hypothetical protein